METHSFNEDKKRFEPSGKTCLFCYPKAKCESVEDSYFAPIYLEKDRTNVIVYRNVKFNEIKVGVPRCKGCRKTHKVIKALGLLIVVLGVLSVFIVPISLAIYFDYSSIWFMGVMIVVTVLIMTLISKFVESYMLSSHKTISEKEGAKKDPLVGEFLKAGWSLERPMA